MQSMKFATERQEIIVNCYEKKKKFIIQRQNNVNDIKFIIQRQNNIILPLNNKFDVMNRGKMLVISILPSSHNVFKNPLPWGCQDCEVKG